MKRFKIIMLFSLLLSMTLLSSFKPTDVSVIIKKGDKIEYRVVGPSKKLFGTFVYFNEGGSSAVGNGNFKLEELNRTFTAKSDNQKVGIAIGLNTGASLRSMNGNNPAIDVKILVNDVVVKEGAIGGSVSMVELLLFEASK